MKVYISGPMTGKPGYNYDEFARCAGLVRDAGHEPLNPATNFKGATTHPAGRSAFMREDFKMILEADAIAVMPGWQDSPGADVEVRMCRELGLPVLDIDTMTPVVEESPLMEAQRIVAGARQDAYGHPFDDFTRTGRMWGAILGVDDVPPDKVALCLIAVKISREVNAPKRDNVVDIAGYAETLALVREHQNERIKAGLQKLLHAIQNDEEAAYGDGKAESHLSAVTDIGDEPTGAPM